MTTKKSPERKIQDAKANLEAAQLLQAVSNLRIGTIEFSKLYDRDIETAKKALNTMIILVDAVKAFNQHTCNGNDMKLVFDIAQGIEARAKYLQEIEDLKRSLNRAQALFEKVKNDNENLRKSIADICMMSPEDRKKFLLEGKGFNLQDLLDKFINNYNLSCSTNDKNIF